MTGLGYGVLVFGAIVLMLGYFATRPRLEKKQPKS